MNKRAYSAFWEIIRPQSQHIVFKTDTGTRSNPKAVQGILTKEFKRAEPPTNINFDVTLLSLRVVVEDLPPWDFETICGSEIDMVLSQLPTKKSTGPDPCSFHHLKILSPAINNQLSSLCNQISCQRKWPLVQGCTFFQTFTEQIIFLPTRICILILKYVDMHYDHNYEACDQSKL